MSSIMTGMGLGVLAWLLIGLMLLALAVAAGVWLARSLRSPAPARQDDHNNARQPTPREVLDRRYAAGEIDEEDYRRRQADLPAR